MQPLKRTLFFSVALLVAGGIFAPLQAQFGNGYSYRREIDIVDAQVIGGPHTNFAVLIDTTLADLRTTANGGKVQNVNGWDIIFTSDQAGTTQLAHEIEVYQGTTGKIVMWVRIESLAATSVIYMFYGNGSIATFQGNVTSNGVTGVWDSNYVGVWHLNETVTDEATTGIHDDATSNNNDAAQRGNDDVPGRIAGGQDFDTDDYADAGDQPEFQLPVYSWSMWIRGNSAPVTPPPGGINQRPISNASAQFQFNWSHWGAGFRQATTHQDAVGWKAAQIATPLSANTWYYIVGTYDGSNIRVYLNGGLEDTEPAGTPVVAAGALAFGNDSIGRPGFAGQLDEVRVSNTPRLAGWIQTEYNNQFSPATFYSLGAEETGPAQLLVRYWFDEAPSGQAAAQLIDDQASPLNLPIIYDGANQTYKVVSTGRGWESTTTGNGGRASTLADGTKVQTVLDGATSATIEIVLRVDALNSQASRLINIGDGSESGYFTLSSVNVNTLYFYMFGETLRGQWDPGFDGTRAVFHLVYNSAEPTAGNRVRLYKNGVLQTKTGGIDPPLNETISIPNGKYFVMANRELCCRSIDGDIYYAAIYDGALTASEVSTNATALLANDDNNTYAVSVTPKGLASPVQRQAGTGYSQNFTVTNSSDAIEDFDLLARVAPSPGSFLTVDSITGTGVSQAALPDSGRITGMAASGSATVAVWYTVASAPPAQVDTLFLRARSISNTAVSDEGWAEVEFQCTIVSATVSTMAELRSAIADACITTININPGTYLLTSSGSGALVIARDLTITNTGGGRAILDAAGASGVFEVNSGTVSMTGLTITGGNVTGANEGGGIRNSGTLTIQQSTITGNTSADADGGGLWNNGTLTLINTTVSGNTAGDDGAGFETEGPATLTNSTIANNAAGTGAGNTGGGVKIATGGSVTLRNTIVADNTQGAGGQIDGTLTLSNGSNVVEGGCSGCLPSDITADPNLGPLADNGGDSYTHAIPANSPAFNAGLDGDAPATDQRGVARPQGAASDIGAFEFVVTYSITVTPDGVDTLQQLPTNGTSYAYKFTVTNNSTVSEDFDLFGFPGDTLATFLTVDSITGPNVTQGAVLDSARITGIAASASDSAFVWYGVANVAAGTLDSLYLKGRSVSSSTVSDSGWVFIQVIKPNMTTVKAVSPNGTQPPGTDLTYTVTITNDGSDDAVSVVIVDSLAVEIEFQVGSVVNNLPTGVTATVEYSNDGGSTWTYTPVSAGCAAPTTYDGCVTHIRWTLQNNLSSVGPDNTGEVQFVARIQ